ncbi:MAG: PD40 domain-containing protein [Sedimentisphaerales bacterium]|nr:PD40 domain-containing protein [Sedimentisphaerales bacterium]
MRCRQLFGGGAMAVVLVLMFGMSLVAGPTAAELPLKDLPYRIVYESLRQTDNGENWELILVNADGTNPVNLTKTPDIDEMYPHASPDGSKICFVADETIGGQKVRNVYFMNIDGAGRTKVAENARQACWSPDSGTIAYLKAEFERYTIKDYATKGIFFYDLKTGSHSRHRNEGLHHLYNICWSPEGKWFLATVHGGMGYDHANLVIEADGMGVYDLTKFGVTGCRPDFRYDNKKLTWGLSDWDICVADIDLSSGKPDVTGVHKLVHCAKSHEIYHSEFSPDGRYIAFSYGPEAQEMVGGKAPGWNICVSDMEGNWLPVTHDGLHNKEPDWVPAQKSAR